MSDAQSELCDFPGVQEAEEAYLKNRRAVLGRQKITPAGPPLKEGRVGLALSGGGIRSATTNLGILQGLVEMRLLPAVDYLSTVSGGGYIGSCLSSLLSLRRTASTPQDTYRLSRPGDALFDTNDAFPLSHKPAAPGQVFAGAEQVAHLRTHGSFLIAHGGLLRRDALRAVGHLLSGGIFTVAYVALMLLGVAAAMFWQAQRVTPIRELTGWAAFDGNYAGVPPVLWLASGVCTLTALVVLGWLRRTTVFGDAAGESEEDVRERRVLVLVAVALAVVAGLVAVQAKYETEWTGLTRLLLPAAFLALTWAFSLVLSWGFAWRSDRPFRSLWGAYMSLTGYGTVFAVLFAIFPVVAAVVSQWAERGLLVSALGSAVSAVASRILASQLGADGGSRRLPTALVRPLLNLTVLLFVLLAILGWSVGLTLFFDSSSGEVLIVVVAVLVAVGGLFNFNKISLHYFYRDRLDETYLRTETPADRDRPSQLVTGRDAIGMKLRDLHGTPQPSNQPQTPGAQPQTTAPYQLISAALNLAGSRDLTRKDRKSGFFLFSKYFCGSKQTGYRRTEAYRAGETKLSRAMTISGAAAGSGIGSQTFFAQAFVTTLFNIRLGYWMENPKRDKTYHRKEGRVFWPWFMFKEVFALTDARSRLVNLSDGGHTGDNVGIYPLLQRRCQVIIACDAEADQSLGFGSFTRALRQAYVDFGTSVDIDLDMIRPDPKTGLSRSHTAVGRIRYREQDGTAIAGENWLIYIKNSMTGDGPAPVENYKHEHHAFPHETTLDQFFDDDQVESYRALGGHMARQTFAGWLEAAGRTQQTPKLTWRTLAHRHASFSAVDAEIFHELTSRYVEIEKMCIEDDSSTSSEKATTGKWAIRVQLMEDVFFGVELGRYANAPDNHGWMNVFRAWSKDDEFKATFPTIKSRYSQAFVAFCEDYIIGRAPIEEEWVPHPWDDEEKLRRPGGGRVTGLYLDCGIAATSE